MQINELVQKAHDNAKIKGFWEDYSDLKNAYKDAILQDDISDEEYEQARIDYITLKNNAIGNRLMLIVSELAEALEGLRKGDIDNFREELADVAIRLGDLCGGLNIDLEAEIIKKMEKNKDRPYKHNKAF